MNIIDPTAIHQARRFLIKSLAAAHKDAWIKLYNSLDHLGDYLVEKENVGRRSLRQVCLDYLISIDNERTWGLAKQQYQAANNMTQRLGAFKSLLHSSSPDRQMMIDDFYEQYRDHALAMDKWLMAQAVVPSDETLENVRALEKKSVFDRRNPNKLRSLVGTFVSQNPVCFHAPDGSGYAYLTEWLLELDAINPQVAARLASSFNNWRSYDDTRQALMKTSLEKIQLTSGLSSDVNEIVSKALENTTR
jgi:aminopeptidase N